MTSFGTRRRLLSGAALGFGLAAFAPQEAAARCVVAPGSTTCSTVITTDTTNASLAPALDRQYNFGTSNSPYAATVESGAVVSGFGLAFTNTVEGNNPLNVVNNGTVQIDAGNFATAGGSAALQVLTIGATPLIYSGTGSVLNLGTGGNGLELRSTGTGGITATVGGNVTGSNVTSRGISAASVGTAGNVDVTTATGTTVRAGFAGVDASITDAASAGTITVVNNGTILSEVASPNSLDIGVQARTFGTGAVSVTNDGAIGSSTDRAGVGVLAVIDNSASSAAVNVQGAGSIFASGAGIASVTNGTGTVNVTTGAGLISAIGSEAGTGAGIVSQATSGATTINVGAGGIRAGEVGTLSISTSGAQTINVAGQITTEATGFDGVLAFSDSGTIAVNVQAGGGITAAEDAITVSSDGAKTINIAAGRTVSGAYGVYTLGTGTTTIVNAGTLTGTEAAVLADLPTDGAVTITNQAGATLNGRVDLTDGNDTLTNAGTFNASGENAFLGGTDTLTNQAGGAVNVAAGTTFTGLETFNNAGTITAASGLTFDAGNTALNNTGTINLTGALDLGVGTDSFSNAAAGILNLTGDANILGAETFSNAGRLNLNAFTLTGAAVDFNNTGFLDTSGNSSLAGFTSFSNAGTLDLAPGTFTVPAALLTNTGIILADEGASTITGQTSFANSGTIDLQDGATGDVLTINSAFAGSGGSRLQVDVDDATADRLVINGAASGTTRIDAVNAGAGLIDVQGRLVVDATTASSGVFTLGTVSGNISPLVNFGLRQDGGDVFLTAVPDQSAFDPLALTRFGPSLWYQSADEVISQTRLPADTFGASFWGQVYGSRDRMDDDSSQSIGGVGFDINRNLRTRRYGAQLGVDYGFGAGRVGLTGGYARAKANDGDAGDLGIKADGFNVGIYGQFGGRTGFHGEVFAKHDRYNLDFNSGAFDGVDTDVQANGIDGAVGYRFPLGGNATLDANAGVSFVRTKFDDVDAFGFSYDLDTVKSTRGRAGLRAAFGGSFSPYLDATVYREFRGDGRVALFDGANTFGLENEGKATWFRLEGGIMPNPTGLMLAAWADFGDRKALGARLGFRFGGAAPVAEPVSEGPAPVVAPPPPPPPATQTCPDGSVILATDACPVPPPPPPPPAPVPERG